MVAAIAKRVVAYFCFFVTALVWTEALLGADVRPNDNSFQTDRNGPNYRRQGYDEQMNRQYHLEGPVMDEEAEHKNIREYHERETDSQGPDEPRKGIRLYHGHCVHGICEERPKIREETEVFMETNSTRRRRHEVNFTAPDFTLTDTDTTTTVRLSSFRGRPVVLVFGSFTCIYFTDYVPRVIALYQRYKGRVHFFIIYCREQHPGDDGPRFSPFEENVLQAHTYEERRATAIKFREHVGGVPFPVLVDTMSTPFASDQQTIYDSSPNRLVIIDAEGVVRHSIVTGVKEHMALKTSLKVAPSVLDRLLRRPL